MLILATKPDIQVFKASELNKLSSYLDLLEANTELVELSNAPQVLFTDDGKTKLGGNKLSANALSQICRYVCPGLIKVLSELANIGGGPTTRPTDPKLAIALFNRIVQSRFELLQGKQLMCNLKTKQIDGIIGAGYQRLANETLLDILETAMELTSRPCSFHSATLTGRSLVACYTYKTPIASKPESYLGGFYFSNSEVGDASIRIGSLLMRTTTGERAINMFKRGRLIHMGYDLLKRVKKTISLTVQREWNDKFIKTRLEAMTKTSLGFSNLTEKQIEAKRDDLIIKLAHRGLSSQLAARVVQTALMRGREATVPQSGDFHIQKSLWASRTVYDLFISLIRDASSRILSVREALERAAYDLVLDKINL